MNRRYVIVILSASLVIGAIAWNARPQGTDPYAALRQARVEPIPGALGYTLEPVEGFAPTVDPARVYAGLVGAGDERDVSLTYALVRDETGPTYGPAWVFITRDLCYFSAKGDFVSPSRSGVGDGCAPNNILVQMVDPQTGEQIGVLSGYDVDGGWLPARVGEPAQALGTTRFH